jgi:hypothetical protein
MVYEDQFISLGYRLPDKKLLRFAKCQAILKFNSDLNGLKRWVNRWNLSHPQTREEILTTINEFKAQQQLEKNPPIVLLHQGWSPYIAINWLPDEKLKPQFYDPAFEEKWSARSGYMKLDKDWSGNNIAYSVVGDRLAAHQLELRLAVYEPKNLKELDAIYNQRIELLYKKATGDIAPLKLMNAVTRKKNISFRHNIYFIRLEKSMWGNITGSYDIIFRISTKKDLM